ncbi:hypothetical protein KQQSB11_300093 [Klebsiella quasipneumoniae subsp. quasipneumoniae]|nr:hypothetical protein KQQSB11_300093 [Klebsiella quasipneumoniae subsp. quasipneumoniae]
MVQELIESISGGGKPVRYGHTHTGQIGNHFTKGGIFAPNSVYIIHAELVIPKHQR